jgi:indolepyruvate ferredoxin oxidoreductase
VRHSTRRALAARVEALAVPATQLDAAPYDILVTGVGGTGVVTVGALISMAAHLEGKSASVLDFMGFAQKGGSVLSFVRFAAPMNGSTRFASTRSRPTCCWPATWW